VADALAKEKIVLYGLLRGDFTAAKAARSKELRKEDPDLAKAVAALPKPSVASEALNVLARDDPSEVRALVQSGKRLRTAQEAAVAGKRGKALSAALDEHRAALERVQRSLGSLELSGPTLERANRTLRAASLDPTLQPLLERGILSEDVSGAGFGIDPGIVPGRLIKRPAPAKPKPDRSAAEKERKQAREGLQAAERELHVAEKHAAVALDELERAKRTVEQARHAPSRTLHSQPKPRGRLSVLRQAL